MTPVLHYRAQALMRRAVTRACVAFPRLNMAPVVEAVWQVYAFEAYCLGQTFGLLEEGIQDEVLSLVQQMQDELLARGALQKMSMGLGPDERKLARKYCVGLDPVLGMQMLRYAQQYRVEQFDLSVRRNAYLTSRRNRIANDYVGHATQQANARFRNSDRKGADNIAGSDSW